MKAPILIDTGYKPHPLQFEFHRKMRRFNVMVCHRRWGKTVLAINTLIDKGLKCDKTNPRYAYVAPLRTQAKTVAWDMLKLHAKDLPDAKFNEAELRVDFTNAHGRSVRISLYGADNPDSMRGIYLDGAVLDEVAQMKPDTWHTVLRPALSDRKGWVLFIGTPKGLNLLYTLYTDNMANPEWYCQRYPVSETMQHLPWLDAEELAEARLAMSDAQYRQEFEADFAASSDQTLITIDAVTAARGKHLRDEQYDFAPVILGVDVARFGDDRSSICRRQGLACFEPEIYVGLNNMELADKVTMAIDKYSPEAVFVDAGRGEGVIDRCRQLGYRVVEIPFGGTARDADHYQNRRIEMWDGINKWLRDGGALPPCAQLIADLVVPTFDYNDTNGKKRLEGKKAMKTRVGRSPDVGDALALTFANPVKTARANLHAKNIGNSKAGVYVTNDDYDVFA
jgi:hypothetical protein